MDEKYYGDLPIVTAADVRLAESVLLMQPGYLPMTPNGDPMFRGSQFNSRINGGQARAIENFFDGGAFGYASGHQESQESAPPVEAIQEVTVVTTTYSAQYGHTSGGFIEYTSKSGTNRFHGSAYSYLANDALNSKGFFKLPKTPLDNKNWGATLGGPIIKNKTFFFVNADWTRFRSGTLEGFGNTTPVDAFKGGDFSALLTGHADRHDVARPADLRGPDLQPRHHAHWSTGFPCATPIRATSSRPTIPCGAWSPRGTPPSWCTPTARACRTTWPATRRATRRGSWTRATSSSASTTTFSPKFKAMFSGYYNNRPSVRNCGGAQGCTVAERPPERFRLEHGLHRRGLHPAHLHDARPHPVGLDHQQQPDEPLHRGLGPLVHGRRQPLRGRELAGRGCGAPSRRAASCSGTRGRRR